MREISDLAQSHLKDNQVSFGPYCYLKGPKITDLDSNVDFLGCEKKNPFLGSCKKKNAAPKYANGPPNVT